jgi:hypothetical protein
VPDHLLFVTDFIPLNILMKMIGRFQMNDWHFYRRGPSRRRLELNAGGAICCLSTNLAET